jgi:cytochrome c oxidase assembly protein subunit 15
MRRLPTLSYPTFRWLALTAAVLLGVIVITGAAVRLTGSGLGCPTWPKCGDGSFVTRPQYSGHGWVEFGNRLITIAVTLIIAVVALASLRLPGRQPTLRWLSWGLVAGIFAQIVLGGFTVLFHLNPALVASHFLLSMLLLLDAVALYFKVDRIAFPPARTSPELTESPVQQKALRALAGLLAGTAAVVLAVGTIVTGAGPHSGDATHVTRFPIEIRTIAQLHADLAMLLVGLTLATACTVYATATSERTRRITLAMCLLVVAQAGVGFLQYALGVPEGLVALHVAGATALWATTVLLTLQLWAAPQLVSQENLPVRDESSTLTSA